MKTYKVESRVHGHHILEPHIGEQLFCKIEDSSAQDVYAVEVIHGATVVHHVPRKISVANMLF